MGLPQTPTSHPYPPSLQLKLYQAFIFSVPILFTIILFLLFYLFYLKKRSSTLSSPSLINTTIYNDTSTVISLPFDVVLKNELKEKLPIVIFDEDLRARDPQCCVCLGDFEIKEQLHQIPSCKHMFHFDCIHHWLVSNATCPLCRALIHPPKMGPPMQMDISQPPNAESSNSLQGLQGHEQVVVVVDRISDNLTNSSSEEQSNPIEGSSSVGPHSMESGNSHCLSITMAPRMD
ncbi:probable E3 ubiquitin-protein ligase RHA4A [Magnolia sinica]|uniref:probable E3 ubiquitin-protein ligase RHA4A n=1 Tax=Magnolia sinica TaxID=86752 RepID=UPI002659FC94|nr:probable E3 ubiquitin-protein ligase RHA4A [Magnolia sinica]